MKIRISSSIILFLFLLQSKFYIFTLVFGIFYFATFHKVQNFTVLNNKIAIKNVLKGSVNKAITMLKLLAVSVVLTLDYRAVFPTIIAPLLLKTVLVTAALDIVWNYEQRAISNDPFEVVSKFTTSNNIDDLHYQIFNSSQFRQKIFDDSDQPTLWKKILVKCEAEIDKLILELKKRSEGAFEKKKIFKDVIPLKASIAPVTKKRNTGSVFDSVQKVAKKIMIEEETVSRPAIASAEGFTSDQIKTTKNIVPSILLPTPGVATQPFLKPSLTSKTQPLPQIPKWREIFYQFLHLIPYGELIINDSIEFEIQTLFGKSNIKLIVQVMMRLVVTSTAQDKYAQVYTDRLRVLTSLVNLEMALDSYIKSKMLDPKPVAFRLLNKDTCYPILKPYASKVKLEMVLKNIIHIKRGVQNSVYAILNIGDCENGDDDVGERIRLFKDYLV